MLEPTRRGDPCSPLCWTTLSTRRWVVKRSFGWLNRHRRLVRDYERLPEHHEAMLLWATTMIMTRQLVRQRTGQPPEPRWRNERTKPQPQQKDPEAA